MTNIIDEYISNQDPDKRSVLRLVRDVIREALPDAVECLCCQMPAWWKGQALIHFAARPYHLCVYLGKEVIDHFAPILKAQGYKFTKGAVQFMYYAVPIDLIREIALYSKKIYDPAAKN